MSTKNLDEEHLARIVNSVGIPKSALMDVLQMPYDEAVALARSVACGTDIGYRLARSTKTTCELPEYRAKTVRTEAEITTCKFLLDRVLQGRLLIHFGTCDVDTLSAYVEFSGIEHLETATQSGRGVCLLNSHYGPGQLAPLLLSRMMGFQITSLSWRDKYNIFGLTDLDRIDVISMCNLFPARMVAEGMRVLRNGGIFHMTGDGFKGLSGHERSFLGMMRRVPEGHAHMVVSTNAVMVPVFTQVDPKGKLTITLHRELTELPDGTPLAHIIDGYISQYLRLLEEHWQSDFGNVPIGMANRIERLHKANLLRDKET